MEDRVVLGRKLQNSTMKFYPLVSVLMTAYNRELYIQQAIESVLNSTYTNFELIIVDDCSSDHTFDIAKQYSLKDDRILLSANKINLGDYPNRNQAASYAKGKYLKYVDSDDLIYPETLAIMVEAMEDHQDAGFAVSSRAQSVTTLFTCEEAYRAHFFSRGLLDYGPTGTIINREKFWQCGGFKKLRNVSDFDFWLRMALRYPVLELPTGLVFWREHENQEIKLAPEVYVDHILPILKEHLNDDRCLLTPEEKNHILRNVKKSTSRALIKSLLKDRDVTEFLRRWRTLNLKLTDSL